MQPQQDMPAQLKRFPQLDGLRGVAVLGVLWFHVPAIAGVHASFVFATLGQQLKSGFIGVDVFFALSGFLITRLLLRERDSTGGIAFKAFYLRRSLRIFPIYYASLAFCAVFMAIPARDLVFAALYASDYNFAYVDAPVTILSSPLAHTWSLAVEEQFYLVWPLLVALLPMRLGRMVTALVVPAIAVALAVLACLATRPAIAEALVFGAAPIRMLSLSLGAYLAYRERDGAGLAGWQGDLLAVFGVVWLAGVQAGRAMGYVATGAPYHTLGNIGFAVLSMGILASMLARRSGLMRVPQRVLMTRPLRYIGRISYGLYLYHYIILSALSINHAEDGAPASRVAAALILSFGLAAVSFHFIEAPLLRLGSQRRSRSAGLRVPATSAT